MAANWGTFQVKVVAFLKGQQSSGFEETAAFFANEYDLAVRTSTLLMGNLAIPVSNMGVMSAFLVVFNLMYNSPVELGPAPYMTLASQIVTTYWIPMQFNPLPPHPPTVAPSPGVQVLFPGEPSSLGMGLYTAFNSGEETLVAAGLMQSFSMHMLTVSGVYNGLIPTATGLVPSPPIPWSGVF